MVKKFQIKFNYLDQKKIKKTKENLIIKLRSVMIEDEN